MHTPDSSRYWIAHSYEERFQNCLEPENVDKVYILFSSDYYRILASDVYPLIKNKILGFILFSLHKLHYSVLL